VPGQSAASPIYLKLVDRQMPPDGRSAQNESI
jgi:hypothetical protein